MQENPYESPRGEPTRIEQTSGKNLGSYLVAGYQGTRFGIFLLIVVVGPQLFSLLYWGKSNSNPGRIDTLEVLYIGVAVSSLVIVIGGIFGCIKHAFQDS